MTKTNIRRLKKSITVHVFDEKLNCFMYHKNVFLDVPVFEHIHFKIPDSASFDFMSSPRIQ